MTKKYDLRPLSFTATTTAANQGTQVPSNFRRYIYRLKLNNVHTGSNRLTVYSRTDSSDTRVYQQTLGAGQTFEPDTPEDLEKAVPILVFDPGSYMRFETDGGDMDVDLLFADEEGKS
jgi:hypothetical protein